MSKYEKINKNKYINAIGEKQNTFQKMIAPSNGLSSANTNVKKIHFDKINISSKNTSTKFTSPFVNKYVPQQSNVIAKSMSDNFQKGPKGKPPGGGDTPSGGGGGLINLDEIGVLAEKFVNYVTDIYYKQTSMSKTPFDIKTIKKAFKQIAKETGYSVTDIENAINKGDALSFIRTRLNRLQTDRTLNPRPIFPHSELPPINTTPASATENARHISGEKYRTSDDRSMRQPTPYEDFIQRLQNEALARENIIENQKFDYELDSIKAELRLQKNIELKKSGLRWWDFSDEELDKIELEISKEAKKILNERIVRENPRTATSPVARAESYTPDYESNIYHSPQFENFFDYLSGLFGWSKKSVDRHLELPDEKMLYDLLPKKLLEHVSFDQMFIDTYNAILEARNATIGRGRNPSKEVLLKTFENVISPYYRYIDYANTRPPTPVASASSYYPAAARTTVRRDLGLTRPPSRYLTNDTLNEHLQETLIPYLGKYDKELAYLIKNFNNPAQFFQDFAFRTSENAPDLYQLAERAVLNLGKGKVNPEIGTDVARQISENPTVLADFNPAQFSNRGNALSSIVMSHPFYTALGLYRDPSKITPLQLSRAWNNSVAEFGRWMNSGGIREYPRIFPVTAPKATSYTAPKAAPSVAVQEANSNTPSVVNDRLQRNYRSAQENHEMLTGRYIDLSDPDDALALAVMGFSPEQVDALRKQEKLNRQYQIANSARDQAELDRLTYEYNQQQRKGSDSAQESQPYQPPKPKKTLGQRLGSVFGIKRDYAPVDVDTMTGDTEAQVLLEKNPHLMQTRERDLNNPVTRRRLLQEIHASRRALKPSDFGGEILDESMFD